MPIISALKKLYWFKGQKIDHFTSINARIWKMHLYAGIRRWHLAWCMYLTPICYHMKISYRKSKEKFWPLWPLWPLYDLWYRYNTKIEVSEEIKNYCAQINSWRRGWVKNAQIVFVIKEKFSMEANFLELPCFTFLLGDSHSLNRLSWKLKRSKLTRCKTAGWKRCCLISSVFVKTLH